LENHQSQQGNDNGCIPKPEESRGKIIAQGVVLGVGPFTDGGNMAIFRIREAAEAFTRDDPFILEGLVNSFEIKDRDDSLLPE